MTERQVQRAVLKMCGQHFPHMLIHHSPNGAHLSGGKLSRFKQAGALKGDGMKNGFPDLICLWRERALFMEIKREKGGVVSQAQKDMIETLRGYGFPVEIITSARQAFDFLKANGCPWNGIPYGDGE